MAAYITRLQPGINRYRWPDPGIHLASSVRLYTHAQRSQFRNPAATNFFSRQIRIRPVIVRGFGRVAGDTKRTLNIQ